MKTTIDNAGRIVIPKRMRLDLGLRGGEEVELSVTGDRIEITPAPRQVKLHRGPSGLLVSDLEMPPHGAEEVREELERARR